MTPGLRKAAKEITLSAVKLLLDNLPPGLRSQREPLAKCLTAIGQAAKVRAIYLFGSYARGEAKPDSDVDLCIVADDAEEQLKAAARWRKAMRPVWPRPAFTLIPISPTRLAEKRARHDPFFATVLTEGVLLATEN
jgi:Nucleotidyltransferase domain